MAGLKRGRAKRLVIDIGSSAVRVCELSRTKTGYQLTKYAQRELNNDPTLEEDERNDLIVEAVQALLKEMKIRQKRVVMGVPGQSVFTRTRQLPPVPEHKVTQIVRYEIQQQIPFSLDQIALDYQVLNRTEAGGYEVLMAAIKVDVVEKHVDIINRVKRQIDTVDVYPLAAYNWLKHSGEFGEEGECVALVDIGAATTEIVIERDNQFRFTRSLNTGGNHITKAIAENFEMSYVEAEQLKRERGFAPTGDAARDGKGGEVIGKVLKRLVGEINRSFAFFRTQPGGGTVSRVVVTGGGACLRNIIPYMQRELGIEVRIAQPLAGLAIAPSAQEVNDHPEQAATVLGLALRMQEKAAIEIDLIPPRVLELARVKQQTFYWALSIATLGLILASIIPVNANKNQIVEQQIATLEKQLGQYDQALVVAPDPSTPSVYEQELAAEQGTIDTLSSQFKQLNKKYTERQFWLDYMVAIAASRPPKDMWISLIETTQIGFKKIKGKKNTTVVGQYGEEKVDYLGVSTFASINPRKGKAAAGGPGGGKQNQRGAGPLPPDVPNGLTIYGYAEDPAAVTEYVERLKASGSFVEVYFDPRSTDYVDVNVLQNANTESTGGTQTSTASESSSGDDDGGGMGSLATMITSGAAGKFTSQPGGPTGVQVVTFELNLQFAGEPIDRWDPSGGGNAAVTVIEEQASFGLSIGK